jgi:hypothetical protein
MSGKYIPWLDIEDIFGLVFPWVSEASEATLPVRRPISYTGFWFSNPAISNSPLPSVYKMSSRRPRSRASGGASRISDLVAKLQALLPEALLCTSDRVWKHVLHSMLLLYFEIYSN